MKIFNGNDIKANEYDDGRMFITTDIWTTFDGEEQEHYQVVCELDFNKSEYGIEKDWVTSIAEDVTYPEVLTKLSLCVMWGEKVVEKLTKREFKKFKNVLSRQNGKYYFQPDQRREIETQICKENPLIAENTMSYENWCISQGIDPDQQNFNHLIINACNDERLEEFKGEYRNLIKRSFGDLFVNDELKEAS